MTTGHEAINIELIPVGQIAVINPRARSALTFRQIVDSISSVGLKKPISVTRNNTGEGEATYNLVCGQGRLEAFISLGQRKIPAIIVDVSEEQSLIMSLAENIARRKRRPLDSTRDIVDLKKRGYSDKEIAAKTGLADEYVKATRSLLEQGEDRLLAAVESGRISLDVATDIARADEGEVQYVLTKAEQEGRLRGRKLVTARYLVETRQKRGKSLRRKTLHGGRARTSSEEILGAYKNEVGRQRLMIRKAETTKRQLLFIVVSMRQLLAEDHFITLLRAEDLTTMPRIMADHIAKNGAN